ncbi:MAG: hypothetical protein ACI8UO_004757 [Verrucomicrobiales bacterium]|jgi:hypothetical protein
MKLLKKMALVVSLGTLVSGVSFAEMGKEVIDPTPVCEAPFTGSVSVGYETTYLFRGADFGDDAPWAGVDLNGQLLGLDVNTGVWYINPTDDPVNSDELDVYLFVAGPDLGPFETSIGGTWFYFAEVDENVGELELDLATSLGPLDIALITVYDLDIEGWYWEVAAGHSIALGDCLDLVLGAGVSYGDSYYGVNGFNHAYATAGLDVSLTETTTLSVYVGGNWPLEDLEAQGEDDDVHGGASISVSF